MNAELHALTQVNRGISNYTLAIARGEFTSLDAALGAAERRRATLQAEVAQLDGSQKPAVVQLTPAMLEGHLQGMTEKLHSRYAADRLAMRAEDLALHVLLHPLPEGA